MEKGQQVFSRLGATTAERSQTARAVPSCTSDGISGVNCRERPFFFFNRPLFKLNLAKCPGPIPWFVNCIIQCHTFMKNSRQYLRDFCLPLSVGMNLKQICTNNIFLKEMKPLFMVILPYKCSMVYHLQL